MAVFSNTIITKKGHALVAKGMTGEQINFTKRRTSDYDYPSSTNFENLTVLGSIKQTVDISAVNIENESTVRVKAAILNTDVTTGYYVKNIGLYANDPDEGEILFSITTATTADFMPAYNGVNTSVLTVDLLTTVSNSGNVNLTVSPGGLVTTEMIATENQYGIVTLNMVREEIENSFELKASIPGYEKRPNGIMEQWFLAQALSSNGEAGTIVNFPYPYENSVLDIRGGDGGSGAHSVGIRILSKTQCIVWGKLPGTTGYIDTTVRIFVKGY